MIFNSFVYIVFLFITTVIYYIIPHKFRWWLLLISSIIFYVSWDYRFLLLMLFTAYVSYITSKKIDQSNNIAYNKFVLSLNLTVSFSLLFVFKYFLFFTDVFTSIFGIGGNFAELKIILPMGISFYTFQAVGYSVDVYKKRIRAEQNFFKFALFLSFFPQLVAGPIERTKNLMPQLFSKKRLEKNNIILGLKYMVSGFFKKIVIADRAAILVNTVYDNPTEFNFLALLIATIIFAFQIYCDFSGYSEIARGSAKILGVDLVVNFKTPYFSKTIREFWRRWHISLSSWFKDYVYFPLGGSKVPSLQKYFNVIVTFLISGLWHGANITFILWGFIHGVIQIIEDIIAKPVSKILNFLKLENFFITNLIKTIITFFIVCFSWIFFRANNFDDSVYIVMNIFSNIGTPVTLSQFYNIIGNLGLGYFEFFILLVSILVLVITEYLLGGGDIHDTLERKPFITRILYYYILTMLIFTLGVFNSASTFIYFQF